MTQATTIVATAASDNEFHPPSISDFFPPALLFEGTPFEFTRISMVQVIATLALVIFLVLGTRRLSVVPGRFQSVVEFGFGFVREQDGRYEVLRGRVRQATRSEGAYSTMNVALIALTHA